MEVKLISYTQPTEKYWQEIVDYQNSDGITALIAYCARVSNPANQLSKDRDDSRLINYLLKHKHLSPFEMVNVCLEINTTRDIARQILRHRSFTFQEHSTRYAEVIGEPEYKEARLQDTKNRQNSIEVDDKELQEWWNFKQKYIWEETNAVYKAALNLGIAKEVARSVLPEGLTPSRLYVNGTIRSWLTYISLRSGNGTQKEHMAIAKACADVIANVFPNIREFVVETEKEDKA